MFLKNNVYYVQFTEVFFLNKSYVLLRLLAVKKGPLIFKCVGVLMELKRQVIRVSSLALKNFKTFYYFYIWLCIKSWF